MTKRATRTAIIDAALGLFEERGYEATTMRAIAEQAGVSVGNAYYYFASKDELIQGFYDRAAVEHVAASADRLATVTGLADRIVAHAVAWFDALGRYHQFAAQFFRVAADPASPLSPFSEQSALARSASVDGWRTVVEGSDAVIPERLRADLPDLLWLYHMGLVLLWVYDRSPGQMVTRLAVAGTAPLIVTAIELTDVPELSSLTEGVFALIGLMRQVRPSP